jgi:hypothetical protein
VKIRKCFVPVDFVVLEMDVCRQAPLILERPFLSTVGATIHIVAGIIQLNIQAKRGRAVQPIKGFSRTKEECQVIQKEA